METIGPDGSVRPSGGTLTVYEAPSGPGVRTDGFGYAGYDSIHYAIHHFPMKRGVSLWLKQYHLRHHFHDDHAGYGVSSPLWDCVFGTRRK